MKLLSILLSLMLAQNVLASITELSGTHKEEVREGLIDSLNRTSLSCALEGVVRPGDRMMIEVIKQILLNDSARFYADESEIRPKITVKRPSNYRNLNYIELSFNTTFDQERVEFIDLYEARTWLERRNTGTVFNPRFEMVEVHDQLLAGRCQLY